MKGFKKLTLLLAFISFSFAMMAPKNSITICLNDPKINFLLPANLNKAARSIGLYKLSFTNKQLSCFTLVKKRLVTKADLLPWFYKKECAKSWQSFHECAAKGNNRADENLIERIDRKFVAYVICQEGVPCLDERFLGWHLRWIKPSVIELSTVIAEDFTSEAEALKILAKINEMLKKVVYGAYFPMSAGEGLRSDPFTRLDFSQSVAKFFELLHLKGLSRAQKDAIAAMAKGGRTIFYLGSGCKIGKYQQASIVQRADGWVAVEGAVQLGVEDGCIEWNLLR